MTGVQPLASTNPAAKYTFHCGQRPLDGYTIKYGIGKGAFGEVYFGLSDGGKEVALKLIHDNLNVELRGASQCLNLKHPNLVHLYDLRSDEHGNYWLIMEFVEGESLRSLLDRHPQGVAPELAAQWFQGIAAGIQYLHDHSIVHRDLKPGNIFLEKGVIKVGDFSLCKLMDAERDRQTQSIGTVHYMAPEISTGKYTLAVDIYAAGVVLYEMLSGKAPFDGDSAGEILMKHLTSMPDLSKIPSAFVPILDQALRKNPGGRFASIADMARKVAEIGAREQESEVRGQKTEVRGQKTEVRGQRSEVSGRESEVTGQEQGNGPPREAGPRTALKGWQELGGSLLYAALLAGIGALAWGTVFANSEWPDLLRVFLPTAAVSWIVLILGRLWTQPLEDSGGRRLVQLALGGLLGLGVMWLDGYRLDEALRPFVSPANEAARPFFGSFYRDNQTLPVILCFVSYYALMLGVLRWWRLTEVRRPEAFNMRPVVATMLWGFVLLFLLPSTLERQAGFAALVLASGIVQLASPCEKNVVVRKKRFRLPGA